MISILWADDQPDVVKTLSSVLNPLSANIVFVTNGNDTIIKLNSQNFDILLLDLAMPPDKWGGLWVLDEIKKAGIKIPIIIISGEGTQNETIKALRLGAQDYVTKDNLQAELLECVKKVLQGFDSQVESDIADHFPTLLSLPYRKYINSSESVARLHRLLEFFEATLRLGSLIGICETSYLEHSIEISEQFRIQMLSPTMGTWNQACQIMASKLPRNSIFFQIYNSFENDITKEIIGLRNDIVHGTEPTEQQAIIYLNNFETQLKVLSMKLWQNIKFDLVMPINLHYDGNSFNLNGLVIAGDSSAFPKLNVAIPIPLICDQVYIWMKPYNAWINLFPFIVIEPSIEPSIWNILVFDGIKVDRYKKLIGNEPLKYINIWTGQRNVEPTVRCTSMMLPKFLTGLSENEPPDSDH